MKIVFALLNSLFLAGCSLFGIQSEESPGYEILEKHGTVEIRQYRPFLVVQTEDAGDYESASKLSFFRLFDYISGKNQSKQKIAMTAPVLQEPKPEKITMTAPVFQEQSGQKWTMRFVLPSQYQLATAPQPTDPAVLIKEIPAKKVAVLEFSGFLNKNNIAEKKEELSTWLKENNLKAISESRSAGYNPPWTIPFLRRNEVHIDIE
ncbi:MAG: heme-binding protein [Methylococcaceae bacterium]|nr:heme-binding protein [Methylococcaceae bacterium]